MTPEEFLVRLQAHFGDLRDPAAADYFDWAERRAELLEAVWRKVLADCIRMPRVADLNSYAVGAAPRKTRGPLTDKVSDCTFCAGRGLIRLCRKKSYIDTKKVCTEPDFLKHCGGGCAYEILARCGRCLAGARQSKRLAEVVGQHEDERPRYKTKVPST